MKQNFTSLTLIISRNKSFVLFFFIFIALLFLRFYQLDLRNAFGWDQVDNAWVSKRLIVDHKFPLIGMVAKQNSGVYIGPAYYYFAAFFYWIFNLNPIASGVIAGATSIFTFFIIYYIVKKLFSTEVALIAVFINTVSFFGIAFDRVQWPVNFIPGVSLIIFYALYKTILGSSKHLIILAFALGLSFHIHFTSVFYPIIILFCFPFFPRTKKMIKALILALLIFLILIAPSIISYLQNMQYYSNALKYGQTYFHGFHLRRVLQLINDAFIQFEFYFAFSILKFLKFILAPLFIFTYLFKDTRRDKLILCYLVVLWFMVPWFVLSTYSGEISDYYFVANRFIVLFIISYLLMQILSFKSWIPKIVLFCFLIYYSVFNIDKFLSSRDIGFYEKSQKVFNAIEKGEKIGFHEGVAESYLYYYYMRKRGVEVY